MDWARECYQSRWRLFADSPATETPGRYYFSPPGTAFVSGSHFYGSRKWLDGNNGLLPSLGESLTARHVFDRGAPPAVLPGAYLVGDRVCLRDGEQLATALQSARINNGFNVLCFTPAVRRSSSWEILSGIGSCSMQAFYLRVLLWMYEHEPTPITALTAALLGPSATATFFRGTTLLPDVVVIRTASGSAVVVDGTQNAQQLALQAFTSIVGPANIGSYGTLPLWYDASTWANQCAADAGVNPSLPIVVVGHSYGGATALNLASRYTLGIPSRPVLYLTFGCPKPGDSRMTTILGRLPGLALMNSEDYVTITPPDVRVLASVIPILGIPGLRVWTTWESTPGGCMVLPSGALLTGAYPLIDNQAITDWANRAVHGDPIPIVPDHSTSVYFARTIARCPAAEWPMTALAWQLITGNPVARGGIMAGGQSGPATLPVAQGGIATAGSSSPPDAPEAFGGIATAGQTGDFGPVARGGIATAGSSSPPDAPEAFGGLATAGSSSPPDAPEAFGGLATAGSSSPPDAPEAFGGIATAGSSSPPDAPEAEGGIAAGGESEP